MSNHKTLVDPPPLAANYFSEVTQNDMISFAWYKQLTDYLRPTVNNGTAGDGVVAEEYGDANQHTTVLTLTGAELSPTIPANAEGAGAVVYTFPAGVFVINAIHMDITSGVMDSATNAADVGIGSVIASGDIATLTPSTMEDYITGQTVADVSSFVVEKSAAPFKLFEAGDSHTMNFNVAATWNSTVATASVTGTITFNWIFLGA